MSNASIWTPGSNNIPVANPNAQLVQEEFTATAGQTTFVLALFTYVTGFNALDVFVNGVKQPKSQVVELSESSFRLLQACEAGDLVEAKGNTEAVPGGGIASAEKHTIWIPRGAMIPAATDGASPGTVESAVNKINYDYLSFDFATVQAAQFQVPLPKSWNLGTLSARFVFMHQTADAGDGVAWTIQAVAISANESIDAAFGTAVQVNAVSATENQIGITDESGPITVGGVLDQHDFVAFKVTRQADDVTNDTLGVVADLIGILLYYTVSQTSDE
jgi:hypothetical protein